MAASSFSRLSMRWRSVPAPALRALANGESPAAVTSALSASNAAVGK